MHRHAAVALATLVLLTRADAAPAQGVRGFAGAGVVSDLNDHRFPAFSGGVLLDLPTTWISAGAQGETFFEWPYFAGRGALFGQANLVRHHAVRAFALGGFGFGETGGAMFGGGLEVRPSHRRFGLRLAVEDYVARVQGFDCAFFGYTESYCDANLRGGRAYTAHQLTVRAGFLF